MSKHNFSEKELLLLQVVLIMAEPERILARFPIASDDLKNITKGLLKKVTELMVSPQEEGTHHLTANKEVFDKHHDKIKGAIELVDGVVEAVDQETHAIFDLLAVIEELCGKELIYPR